MTPRENILIHRTGTSSYQVSFGKRIKCLSSVLFRLAPFLLAFAMCRIKFAFLRDSFLFKSPFQAAVISIGYSFTKNKLF